MQISHNLDELIDALFTTHGLIAIIPHLNPDGDAISSCLALSRFLQHLGNTTIVISPNDFPDNFLWQAGAENILIADKNLDEAKSKLKEAKFIFCLDFGVPLRAKPLDESIQIFASKCVNIDHHIDFTPFAQYYFRDIAASSTAELIFRFIAHLGKTEKIDSKLADCIYTGILTDTGSFRYSISPNLHRIVADLMELGADPKKVNNLVFNTNSLNKTKFLGFCLSEKLFILEEYRTAYILVTRTEYESFKLKPGETDGLVNFTLSIAGINLGILLIETEEHVKMSFRSVGSFYANKIAAHFGGGGHLHAAGARSFKPLTEVEEKLLSIISHYKEELNYDYTY